jgi:UDP-N-acetylmuramoyl-tripeptide--D-alanyl-D-alanine ligase
MIAMRLSEAATPVNGTVEGEDVGFVGVSTDTRDLRTGQLFVALHGPNFDAHQFLSTAAEIGAAAAMVDRQASASLPLLKVADTRMALGQLAAAWRAQFRLPVLAVTGSNGKTTVKEMTAAILAQAGSVLATQGNLNNDIGVPLTLFNLATEHRYAVIEMGANHPGEIASLCKIARPAIATITLCAPAHLEGFGSVEGVARAKGEIVSGLADDGVAILNADDPYVDLWRGLAGRRRIVTFGLSTGADVTAQIDSAGDPARSRFILVTPLGEVGIDMPLAGRHNVMNALAAAAAAQSAGVDLDAIRRGLQGMHPVKGRLVVKQAVGGTRLIDDTYNANPSSLRAAIDVLVRYPGQHWLVLGDMGELGEQSQQLHHEAGDYARSRGVHRIFALGELSRSCVAGFGSGAEHFASAESLIEALRDAIEAAPAGTASVLVKGSRSMRMERVVQALATEATAC